MPDKHVIASRLERTEALGVEITRLAHSDGDIPIVATTYRDRIRVSYSWPGSVGWRGVDILHSGFPDYSYQGPLANHFDLLSRGAWCARIGVTSAAGRVFIVFKRRLQLADGTSRTALWIDALTANQGVLERRVGGPVPIPLDGAHRAGFNLAAGYDGKPNRLVIVTQVHRTSAAAAELLLLSTDRLDGDLSAAATWDRLSLGAGGWDLHGVVSGGSVYCLHRATPYAVEMPAPWPVSTGGIPTYLTEYVDATQLDYRALQIVAVPADLQGAPETLDDLPGGIAPRLQSVSPPAYTCERWSAGAIGFSVTDPFGRGVNLIRGFDFGATRRRASLFWLVGAEWRQARVMELDESVVARTPLVAQGRWTLDDAIVRLPTLDDFSLATVRARCSMACPRFERTSGSRLEVDVLHHRPDVGALVLTRLDLDEREPVQDPPLNRYGVVDINHGAVPAPTEIEPNAPENDAFARTTRGARTLTTISSEPPLGVVTYWRREGRVDHRVARDVALSRRTDGSADIAYVHAGDGGARAEFSANLESVPSVVNPEGRLDPGAVGGSVHAATTWHAIPAAPAGGWTDFNLAAPRPLDAIDRKTFFTGLDEQIHRMFELGNLALEGSAWEGVLTNSGRRLTFRRNHIDALQAWLAADGRIPNFPPDLENLSPLPPLSSVTTESDAGAVTFTCPAVLFRGQRTRLDATGSFLADTAAESMVFEWEFTGFDARNRQVDSWRRTVQEPRALVSFTSTTAIRYQVRLTIRAAGSELTAALDDVPLRAPLWDELWSMRDRLTESLRSQTSLVRDVGEVTVRVSKYTLAWQVDQSGNRAALVITLETRYGGRYRFRGNPAGQGQVELALPIHVALPGIRLSAPLDAFARVSADVRLQYRRSYTPALLARDPRSDPRQGVAATAASWTMKPTGNATSTVEASDVRFRWTTGGAVLVALAPILVTVLVGLGLGYLAPLIGGMLAAIAALASSIFGIIAAIILTGVLIGVLAEQVPREIERAIEGRIRSTDFTPQLNESGLVTDAGEGLAEALAARVLEIAGVEPRVAGENRGIPAVWSLVYVTDRECRVQHASAIPPP